MAYSFSQDIQIFNYECDPWNRMTPGSALRRVQEIATAHCESLGLDDDFYQRTATAFLLAKVSLETRRMPAPAERVRLTTYAYGMDRAIFKRTNVFRDADGEVLCEVDSRWVLVNTETHRILRKAPPEVAKHYSEVSKEDGHDFAMPKPSALFHFGDMSATYSLCDKNRHINNTRYADLMCDHLPVESLEEGPIQKMVVNYHNEIPLCASFGLYGTVVEGKSYYFQGKRDSAKDFEGYVRF